MSMNGIMASTSWTGADTSTGNLLKGTCITADYSLLALPSSFVQSILPPDLTTADHPFNDVGIGLHPVLLMYNDTTLSPNLGCKIRSELHYSEFIISIPYVRFKESSISTKSYIFLTELYLDDVVAVKGARLVYYLNKKIGEFQFRNAADTVFVYLKDEVGNVSLKEEVLKYKWNPQPIHDLDTFKDHLSKLQPMLRLPVVTCSLMEPEAGSRKHKRHYKESIYDIRPDSSTFQPGTFKVTNVLSKFLPLRAISIPSLEKSVMGSFRFKYDWTLTSPADIATLHN